MNSIMVTFQGHLSTYVILDYRVEHGVDYRVELKEHAAKRVYFDTVATILT